MYIGNRTRVTGWMIGTVAALGLSFALAATATDIPSSTTMAGMDMTSSTGSHDMSTHDMSTHDMATQDMPAHDMSRHQTMSSDTAVSSWHAYSVPGFTLLNQHGAPVNLNKVLTGDRPVLVQFFYASCTTICGVRSAQLVSIAKKLVKADIDIEFYTITTDPDRDTPSRLLSYSQEFGTPPANWQLITGTLEQTKKTQAAFDASDPADNRMFHRPETFIRAGKNEKWLRIDGMTTARQLEDQIKMVVANAGAVSSLAARD